MLDLTHLPAPITRNEVAAQAARCAHLLDAARKGLPEFADSNGWLDPDILAGEETLARIVDKANQIRQSSDAFVLIGVGGSNNAARAVIEALRPNDTPEIIYAGNSTAPSALLDALRRMEKRSVSMNIVAKNFETLEPGAAFRILRAWMYERYGQSAAARITATGTPGSPLAKLALEHGWDFFAFPEDVGGRYSALTNVGLLPMAVAGVDIRALTEGAKAMRKTLLETPAEQNPALLYAAARSLLKARGCHVELLSCFEPRLAWFTKWWIQLFGESEGKNGKGLFPAACQFSEELHSMGQFLQQGSPVAFETFLHISDESGMPRLAPDGVNDGFSYLDDKPFSALNEAAFSAALSAHAARLPCLVLRPGPLGEGTLGALFYFFSLACVFACRMAEVDPFDQPGVEDYKRSMFAALGKEK